MASSNKRPPPQKKNRKNSGSAHAMRHVKQQIHRICPSSIANQLMEGGGDPVTSHLSSAVFPSITGTVFSQGMFGDNSGGPVYQKS